MLSNHQILCVFPHSGMDWLAWALGLLLFPLLNYDLYSLTRKKRFEMYAELEQALLSVQELYDSRGGRPGLSVLTSLLVSLDVKLY